MTPRALFAVIAMLALVSAACGGRYGWAGPDMFAAGDTYVEAPWHYPPTEALPIGDTFVVVSWDDPLSPPPYVPRLVRIPGAPGPRGPQGPAGPA